MTMTNILRSVLFLLFVFLVPCVTVVRAEENAGNDQILGQFEEIKTRLANVEKQQQELADKDNEILAKLDQLRVWVHRK